MQVHYTSGSFRIFSNVNIVGKAHENYRCREIHNCHLGDFSLLLLPLTCACPICLQQLIWLWNSFIASLEFCLDQVDLNGYAQG